jgi:hypothetical protein
MAEHRYKKDEAIDIVAGVYKKQGKGIFKSLAGKKMCTVVILDGDKEYTRTIYLTSIRPQAKAKAKAATTTEDTVTIPMKELAAIKEEVQVLTVALRKLQIRINKLEDN